MKCNSDKYPAETGGVRRFIGRRRNPPGARRCIRGGAIAVLLMLLFAVEATRSQDPSAGVSPDVERMVRDGMAEALDARFRGGRSPEELRLLAFAYANKGARARTGAEKERAFERAEELFDKCLIMQDGGTPAPRRAVEIAGTRIAYGNILLGQRAASRLDELELSAGRSGDRSGLQAILRKADEQYRQAGRIIAPLAEELFKNEEVYLAAGIADDIQQIVLDAKYNAAWVAYYLGSIEADERARSTLLDQAARAFASLLESAEVGASRYACLLGAGMALREIGRLDEAQRLFDRIFAGEPDRVVTVRAQYELARLHIRRGRFEEARSILNPLASQDPDQLAPDDRAVRFYVSLAKLWDANSYLLEAQRLSQEAAGSAAAQAMLIRAQRMRETGIARMARLRSLGGAWPSLVAMYISAVVDVSSNPRSVGPLELLASAELLLESHRPYDARERLEEISRRPDVDRTLLGDALFLLGKCQYQLSDTRAAAEAFARLAGEFRSHERSSQAATFAYQLWARIAQDTRKPGDYERLADVLMNLLQSYPDHPERLDAAWWLPVALQRAGRFDEAARQFANVPSNSPRAEEARFRKALCARLAAEALRGAVPPAGFSAALRSAADELAAYARNAWERAQRTAHRIEILKWCAEAMVHAAEVLVDPAVGDDRAALAGLGDFEQRFPESPLIGRVLGVRIRAHRGLREYEQASAILQQFLQNVPPEKTGAVLGELAAGMQEEVQRLQDDGDAGGARKLAAESVQTFTQLEQFISADLQRIADLHIVRYGRAQMLHIAGDLSAAAGVVAELLKEHPRNGNYQRLHAMILDTSLGSSPTPEQLQTARDAWAVLLRDPGIRKRAPERYWEARYRWLDLGMRLGRYAEVEKVLRNDRAWHPDLGGAPWADRLNALYREVRTRLGEAAPPDSP